MDIRGSSATNVTALVQQGVNDGRINFGPGTWKLDGITVPDGQTLELVGDDPETCILKHNGGAVAPLIQTGTGGRLRLTNLGWNGNKGQQTNRINLIDTLVDEVYMTNCRITDSVRSALHAGVRACAIVLLASSFTGMDEASAEGGDSQAVWSQASGTLVMDGCQLTGALPSATGKAPGGISVSTDVGASVAIRNCTLRNLGQKTITDQDTGAIYLYKNCGDTKIINNWLYDCSLTPVSVQKASNVDILGNLISGEMDSASCIAAIRVGGRSPNIACARIRISGNTIIGCPSMIGIDAEYDSDGQVTDLSVVDNVIDTVINGMKLSQFTSVQLIGNTVRGLPTSESIAFHVLNGGTVRLVSNVLSGLGVGVSSSDCTVVETANSWNA